MDTGISGNHTSAADMSAFHNCPRKSIFFTEMLLFCTQILPFFAWLLPVCTWMLPFCKGGEGEIFSAVSRLLIYVSFYAFQVFFQWLQYIDSHKMRTNPIKWSNTSSNSSQKMVKHTQTIGRRIANCLLSILCGTGYLKVISLFTHQNCFCSLKIMLDCKNVLQTHFAQKSDMALVYTVNLYDF